jgi:hypothetical protein
MRGAERSQKNRGGQSDSNAKPNDVLCGVHFRRFHRAVIVAPAVPCAPKKGAPSKFSSHGPRIEQFAANAGEVVHVSGHHD